ncbi:DNA alkylation repair protein [Metabacillus indicus]|uniref:DNA alkylation repair protein n=1 Tax=Metabacillus indicus TaxID=246786 RepID=UPI002492F725|nr:DNA alkylation repair protein [Metabacillus indicus]
MDYAEDLRKLFREHADAEKAHLMSAYMRGQFQFFGIRSPERKELTKQFLRKHGNPASLEDAILKLWAFEERELQYAAVDILERNKKQLCGKDMVWLKTAITTESWWDTVDLIASNIIGPLVKKEPSLRERYLDEWAESENIWLVRTAILHQLKYKANTDEAWLYRVISQNSSSKEFFIQKAIGWALREYSKTAPASVKAFAENHPLAPLSRREGLKYVQ